MFELLWHSAHSKAPVLKWGYTSKKYIFSNYAYTVTINRNQMCGYPANSSGWRDFGLIHTSLFCNNMHVQQHYTNHRWLMGPLLRHF